MPDVIATATDEISKVAVLKGCAIPDQPRYFVHSVGK